MTSRRLILSLALVSEPVCACAGQQSPLSAGSDQARDLLGLGQLMTLACAVAYLLVLAFLGLALWRRRRPAPILNGVVEARTEAALHRGLKAWVGFVAVTVFILAGASFATDRLMAVQGPTAPLQVRVTGQQWWWRIAYRSPATGQWIETANELRLPADRPARIELTSADVIHSFWIPGLHGKLDMIPGRTNVLTVTPRQLGWLRGQCAEFCGLQHAQMALSVKVEPSADFDAWLAAQALPARAPPGPGLALVENGPCATCHTIRGTQAAGANGPDLTHLASRRQLAAGALAYSRGGLAGWITQPQALKPGAEMPASGLDPGQTNDLVAYLEGLR
jgi:cytochrome c oxidase subunit 2